MKPIDAEPAPFRGARPNTKRTGEIKRDNGRGPLLPLRGDWPDKGGNSQCHMGVSYLHSESGAAYNKRTGRKKHHVDREKKRT